MKHLSSNSLLECFYSDKSLKLNDSTWRNTLAVVSSSCWVSCASVFSRSWRWCKCLEKGGWVNRTRSSFQPLGRPPPSLAPVLSSKRLKAQLIYFSWPCFIGWFRDASTRESSASTWGKVWCDHRLENMRELGVKQAGSSLTLVTASIGY